MNLKRNIQELNGKIAILEDYIHETTKELQKAIDDCNKLKLKLKEAYEYANE